MKTIKSLLRLMVLLTASAAALAASHGGAPAVAAEAKKDSALVAPADMAQGEIRKVDLDNKKITIKHGEIKSLDMPGMTMVFRVKDEALLGRVKAGDKIRFRAEKIDGAIVVTDIQVAP